MDLEGLVAEARERRPKPMPARERRVFAAMAAAFLAGAVGIALAIPHDRAVRPGIIVALVLLQALTFRARFEIGTGIANPTALAYVPMLFMAPLRLVHPTDARALRDGPADAPSPTTGSSSARSPCSACSRPDRPVRPICGCTCSPSSCRRRSAWRT